MEMLREFPNAILDYINNKNMLVGGIICILIFSFGSIIPYFQNIEWIIAKLFKTTNKKFIVKRIDGENSFKCMCKIFIWYFIELIKFPAFIILYLIIVRNFLFCTDLVQQNSIYMIIYVFIGIIILIVSNKILKIDNQIYYKIRRIIITMLIGIEIELEIYYKYHNLFWLMVVMGVHTAVLAIFFCGMKVNHYKLCKPIRNCKHIYVILLMAIITPVFYKLNFNETDKNNISVFLFLIWILLSFGEYLYIWMHYEDAFVDIFIKTTDGDYKTKDKIIQYDNKVEYRGQNGEKHLVDEKDILQFMYEKRKLWTGKSDRNFIVYFNPEKKKEEYNGYTVKNQWIYLWKKEERIQKVVIVKENKVYRIDEI